MITLRIFLIGLIAFVPDKENGALTVVFQEARQMHHPHYPIFVYECKNDPLNGLCEIAYGDELVTENILNVNREFEARILSGEQIRVVGAKEGKVQYAPGRHRPVLLRFWNGFRGDVPENLQEARAFSWIPTMRRASFTHRFIAKRHLNHPNPEEIAGLLNLRGIGAEIGVAGFADIATQVHSFTFKKPSAGLAVWDYKQSIPDVAVIEIPLSHDYVEFGFKPFGTNQEAVLRLQAAQSETVIDVVLGNLPPYEYGIECEEPEVGRDDHFNLYYRLSAVPTPAEGQIPFRGDNKVRKSQAEDPPSRIVHFIESEPCFTPTPRQPNPSSSNRPICTQVVFDGAR